MADETYYSLLEVSETASAVEIKAAYLRLIREVHPDRLANAPAYWQRQAEEKSKEINEAYSVLSNPAKRSIYDAQLAAYRGSRSTTSRQSTSQASSQPPPSSSQQRSRTSAHSQYYSGSGASSAHTPPSNSQRYQAASNSTTSANSQPRSSSQHSPSGMSAVQRFFFAFVGSIFGLEAAALFWTTSSTGTDVFTFLLAVGVFFGVACLYQLKISRIFLALHIKGARQQLWGTIGIIAVALLVGKAVSTTTQETPHSLQTLAPNDLSISSQQATAPLHEDSRPVKTQEPIADVRSPQSIAQNDTDSPSVPSSQSLSVGQQTSASSNFEPVSRSFSDSRTFQTEKSLTNLQPSTPSSDLSGVCAPRPGEDSIASGTRAACCEGSGNACSNMARFYETGAQNLAKSLSLASEFKQKACKLGARGDCSTTP